MFKKLFYLFAITIIPVSIYAAEVTVTMYFATDKGAGERAGEVVISESEYGLVFTPNFKNIKPGIHGFHIHANGDCSPTTKDGVVTPAGAAGGHLDPKDTKTHKGPFNSLGHLGDLPAVYSDANGDITYPVLSPKIKKIDEIRGKSLMLHVGGDNHADQPAPLGGGGARLACGVI